MTTLTLKFDHVYEEVINDMIKLGIAKTKSEAVRMALLSFGLDTGLIDSKKILRWVRKDLEKNKLSENQIALNIVRAKQYKKIK